MIWLSSHLTYHLIISDSAMWKRLQNVYSQIKQNRLKPLSQPIWQPPLLHPVSYQPPTHRRLLVFPVCASSSVKTPLSSQVGNLIFIPAFNVLSSVLSIVLFLRASCCFPAAMKTRSIPPPDPGQPSYDPFYHILSNERSNELLLSHNRWFQGEKYRSPPCQTSECVRLTVYGHDRSILLKGILKSIL